MRAYEKDKYAYKYGHQLCRVNLSSMLRNTSKLCAAVK